MNLPGRDSVLDIIKGSVGTLVLFLAFVSIPAAGLFPGMFVPLPALFYSLKQGRIAAAAIVVITSVVLGLMGDPATVALYLLEGGVLAIAISWFLGEGKGAARSLAYSVAVTLGLIIAAAAIYGTTSGVNIDRQVLKGIETSIAQTGTFYEKAGLKGEELETLKKGLEEGGRQIGRVYPAMMIISLVSIAGLNMLALARLSLRLPGSPSFGPFREFRNPEHLVWVLIAAGFAMLVPDPGVSRVALNVLIVTVFMYFLQGLAVVLHYFTRISVSPFLRVVFYVLLAVQPYLGIGLAVIGIFDMWGNFRTPKNQANL